MEKKNWTYKQVYDEYMICLENDEVSPILSDMFIDISKKTAVIMGINWRHDFYYDCWMYAYTQLLFMWKKFDPKKSNAAFPYFMSIAKNAIKQQSNQLKWGKLNPTNKPKIIGFEKF